MITLTEEQFNKGKEELNKLPDSSLIILNHYFIIAFCEGQRLAYGPSPDISPSPENMKAMIDRMKYKTSALNPDYKV